MKSFASPLRSATAFLLLAVPAVCAAADSPLSVIPDTADVVLRLKKPKSTIDNLIRTANSFDPKFGTDMKKWTSAIGTWIGNPQGTGVDSNHDWYVAYFYTAGKDPATVFVIPTTKSETMEKAVKETLGSKARFKSHEKWLFYSDNDAAMTLTIDGINGTAGSIAQRMDSDALAIFDRNDVGMFVNVRHLTDEVYKIELAAYREVITAIMQDVPKTTPKSDGVALEGLFEFYGRAFEEGLEVLSDVENVTGGASLKGAGVDAEQIVRLKEGSSVAEKWKSGATSAMPLLEKLPTNRLMYLGLSGPVKSWNGSRLELGKLSSLDTGAVSKAETALGELDEIQFGTQATALTIGDPKEGLIRAVTVTEITPSDKIQPLMRNALAVLHPVLIALNASAEVAEDGEDAGDQKVDVVRLKLVEGKDSAPQLWRKFLQGLFRGTESGTARVAYLPDSCVETLGGGTSAVTEALQSLTGAAAAKGKPAAGATPPKPNAAIAAPRGKIAPAANVVMIVDAASLSAELIRVASDILGSAIPVQSDQVKKLSLRRSYMGASVVAEENGLRLKAHVPTTQLQSMSKVWPLAEKVLKINSGPIGMPAPMAGGN